MASSLGLQDKPGKVPHQPSVNTHFLLLELTLQAGQQTQDDQGANVRAASHVLFGVGLGQGLKQWSSSYLA